MRRYAGLIHGIFLLVALMLAPRPARSQRGPTNGYLGEKMHEQERHIDATDATVQKLADEMEGNRSRLDRDEGIFIGADGLLGVLLAVGAIKRFNQGKESNG